MEFMNLTTNLSYPFSIVKLEDKIVLREIEYLDYTRFKSLTNNIEHVLEWVSSIISKKYTFYQVDGDGLFELKFNRNGTLVENVKWELVSKDAEIFNILYSNPKE